MSDISRKLSDKFVTGVLASALLLMGYALTQNVYAHVAGETFALVVSATSNHAAPAPLAGATLNGDAFIFLSPKFPASGISEVNFYLDDLTLTNSIKRERRAPYDLRGGGTLARPFDTTSLSDGMHNLTAVVTFADGHTPAVIPAGFTVNNGGGPPGPLPGPAAFEFGFSMEADRTFNAGLIPDPLEIEALTGQQFFFLADAANCTVDLCPPLQSSAGIVSVDFSLDGVVVHTDILPPYDFAGDNVDMPGLGLAEPLDLELLTPGIHTIAAAVFRTDGTVTLLERQFLAIPFDDIIPLTLKGVPIPEDPNIMAYVKDRGAAIALGRALFFDTQMGSSGEVACGTCHYHAGVDNRTLNTVNPKGTGFQVHDVDASGQEIVLADFPFHKISPPLAPAFPAGVMVPVGPLGPLVVGTVIDDHDDIVGSQGVLKKDFAGNSTPITSVEDATGPAMPETTFLDALGMATIQSTGRNTPTNNNAVFNVRNFWDGRANFVFNGRNPFGARDTGAMILATTAVGGPGSAPLPEQLRLTFASLASQAVGPPQSNVETSWNGRRFHQIGRKLLALRPLQQQMVHAADSTFGPSGLNATICGAPGCSLVDSSGMGLNTTYSAMIEAAFVDRLWNGADVMVDGLPFTHKEANFSVYWGIAIMMWEQLLVSDDSRFDRLRDGTDAVRQAKLKAALDGTSTIFTPQETEGMLIFVQQGQCVFCHGGPVFSAATVPFLLQGALPPEMPEQVIEVMLMQAGEDALGAGDPNPPFAVYDLGFYNIGVRPTSEDIGIGGTDDFGNPLSFSEQITSNMFVDDLTGVLAIDPCFFAINVAVVPPSPCFDVTGQPFRHAVDGALKTQSLRNVELTGPYFHNGGQLTLEQVVQFYARGGDFRFENIFNLDPEVFGIPDLQEGAPNAQTRVAAVVAFLKTLTDDRVRLEMDPFDHPEIPLPNGDVIPAVGEMGGPALTLLHTKLAAAGGPPPPPPPPSMFGLGLSLSADRSAGSALEGATLAGNAYIFLTPIFPMSSIADVKFYLDDPMLTTATKRERTAPYDLAGGSSALAKPFNTAALTNGAHNLTAVVTFTDGTANAIVSANFSVNNVAPPPGAFGIGFSLTSNRAAPTDLNGAMISGNVYIFLTPIFPTANITEVNFYLDDPGLTNVTKRERKVPYDLAGGSPNARAFNANSLATGNHVLVAVITLADGSTASVTANFSH